MTIQVIIFLVISTFLGFEPSYNKVGYVQKGVASYYAEDFHGKKTANGEKFNMNDLTAAHPRIRFNTLLKVTNLDNGKEVTVRINDRGPYVGGRILDLSRAAAKKIDMVQNGTANIKAEVIAVEQFGQSPHVVIVPDKSSQETTKDQTTTKKQTKVGSLLSRIADVLGGKKKDKTPLPKEEPMVVSPSQQEEKEPIEKVEKSKVKPNDKPIVVEPIRRTPADNLPQDTPKETPRKQPNDKPIIVEPVRRTPVVEPTPTNQTTNSIAEDKFNAMSTYNIWATEKFPDGYGVQIGSFTDLVVAMDKAKELQKHQLATAYLQIGFKDGKKVYRILAGEGDVSVARSLVPLLQAKGYSGIFVKQHY